MRSIVAIVGIDALDADPDAYRAIAETLSSTGVFGLSESAPGGELVANPTAFRPPLYPYLLSWLTSEHKLQSVWVAVFHVFLGVATAVLTSLTCASLFEGGRIGRSSLLASGLVIIDPVLLQQSCVVMTETFAACLAISLVWMWTKCVANEFQWKFSLLLSVLLALAYLCRPPFLVSAVLLSIATVFAFQSTWKHRIVSAFVVGSCVLLSLGAWTARNVRSIGHPVWATSHGGYTLLLANNPSFYDYLRSGNWGETWDAQQFLESYQHRYEGDPNTEVFWHTDWSNWSKGVSSSESESVTNAASNSTSDNISEHDDDRRSYNAARATIEREPVMFVWSCLVRAGRFWSPVPHKTHGRSWLPIMAIGIFYLLSFVAAFATIWRFGKIVFRRQFWAIWILAFTLTAIHAVYWSNLRMRAPLVPAVAIFVSAILVRPETDGAFDVVDD